MIGVQWQLFNVQAVQVEILPRAPNWSGPTLLLLYADLCFNQVQSLLRKILTVN